MLISVEGARAAITKMMEVKRYSQQDIARGIECDIGTVRRILREEEPLRVQGHFIRKLEHMWNTLMGSDLKCPVRRL